MPDIINTSYKFFASIDHILLILHCKIMQSILIESQYAPPVAYYKALLTATSVTIDRHEHFRKGTYRNRCHIMGANALLPLSIPLVKGKHQHSPMHKVRISYNESWQKDHWMSLTSSYRRSPYFEFYEEYFSDFYHHQYPTLLEFNQAILQTTLQVLKLKPEISLSDKYYSTEEWQGLDLRSAIHPNPLKNTFSGNYTSYPQVFIDRMSFLPNLSIFDLLFHLGPRSVDYILNS
jgi:hypothetical protein